MSERSDVPNPRGGHDRLARAVRDDPYRARRKLPEPSVCPDCLAVYREGRWLWSESPWGVPRVRCPACQRIADGYPAGYVTLRGAFVSEHTEELLGLARNIEAREKAEHALNRIMSIERGDQELQITTTDLHLARAIAHAVHAAYSGELEMNYSEGESLLRATWTRGAR
jgi:NMD protein affecting ribosome stability and mRNA decay